MKITDYDVDFTGFTIVDKNGPGNHFEDILPGSICDFAIVDCYYIKDGDDGGVEMVYGAPILSLRASVDSDYGTDYFEAIISDNEGGFRVVSIGAYRVVEKSHGHPSGIVEALKAAIGDAKTKKVVDWAEIDNLTSALELSCKHHAETFAAGEMWNSSSLYC